MVLDVDPVRSVASRLGLKQCLDNPWETFVEKYPSGTVVEGEVKNKTEFGLFVGLDGDVDGMVHLSDLDWNRPGEQVIEEFRRGDKIKAVVLDVDVDKERISLGVKQLAGDPFEKAGDMRRGAIVTCEVTEVKESGIDVKIVDTEFSTFIKRSELARERGDQRPDRFAVGERLDARVIQFDRKTRKVSVSIKGARDGRREGSDRSVRFVRLGRLARRHPRRGAARPLRRQVIPYPVEHRSTGSDLRHPRRATDAGFFMSYRGSDGASPAGVSHAAKGTGRRRSFVA